MSTNYDSNRVNHQTLMAALKAGPVNVRELAALLGRSSPWKLEDDVKVMEQTFRNLANIGIAGQDVPFTVFPARERARYGFPDIVPEVKTEDPTKRKRKVRNADAKAQKQYWPIVVVGDITPEPAGENVSAYDGRHDEDIETLRDLLAENGFECLEIKGRMVRGGSGIYISMVRDADTETADDSGEIDISGVVTGDHVPATV